MLKELAFIVKDLCADSIRGIKKMISDSCRGKITEYCFMDSNGRFARSKSLLEESATENTGLALLHLGY
jgi:hypothetical protein